MTFRILEWDSKFFNLNVAQIPSSIVDQHELQKSLKALKEKKVDLAYWSAEKRLPLLATKKLNATLVDEKKTYGILLESEPATPLSTITPYHSSFGISDLERLAIQSGVYSRFAVDPQIQKEQFEDLYKTWIRRSISKEIADEVFVVPQNNQIIGMITVGSKKDVGDIGLLAVDSHYRGNKYGEHLVMAAHHWLYFSGFRASQVVTQGNNIAACKLYEKCGYSVLNTHYFYHFWI